MDEIIDFVDAKDVRLLLIEDSAPDAARFKDMCTHEILNLDITRKNTIRECLPLLEEQKFDAIFMDLNITDSVNPQTIHAVRTAAPKTPIIILSNFLSSLTKKECLKHGATGVLLKSSLNGEIIGKILKTAGYNVRFRKEK